MTFTTYSQKVTRKEVIIHSEKMAMEESFNLIGSLKLEDLDSKKMQCKS